MRKVSGKKPTEYKSEYFSRALLFLVELLIISLYYYWISFMLVFLPPFGDVATFWKLHEGYVGSKVNKARGRKKKESMIMKLVKVGGVACWII